MKLMVESDTRSYTMKTWIGKTLVGIAILHTVGGVLFFASDLRDISGAGVVNTISHQQEP